MISIVVTDPLQVWSTYQRSINNEAVVMDSYWKHLCNSKIFACMLQGLTDWSRRKFSIPNYRVKEQKLIKFKFGKWKAMIHCLPVVPRSQDSYWITSTVPCYLSRNPSPIEIVFIIRYSLRQCVNLRLSRS